MVDFPQHVLTKQGNMYKICVDNDLKFKFKLVIPVDLDNYEFCLPLVYLDSKEYHYNFIVDWGDNTSNTVDGFQDINKSHIYNSR